MHPNANHRLCTHVTYDSKAHSDSHSNLDSNINFDADSEVL